jgi:hypothetical protein|eukprot:TRINITY_DN25926_c0_g1_i1.p1 TRINITY_DN25926_c0_g1~~TRINITY_DN25926_c0_g1_i1.p1  ORF type:complete len:134 (+),score=12.48 TRINITY_DN25926_c0_g1_i1:354-755(+)
MFVLSPFIPGQKAPLPIPECPRVSMRLSQVLAKLLSRVLSFTDLCTTCIPENAVIEQMIKQTRATMSGFAVVSEGYFHLFLIMTLMDRATGIPAWKSVFLAGVSFRLFSSVGSYVPSLVHLDLYDTVKIDKVS